DTFLIIGIIMAVRFKKRLVFQPASFNRDMLMVHRHIKLLDFGLCKFVDDDFADLLFLLIYDKFLFSQVNTFFIGIFGSSFLWCTGQIVLDGMIEVCTPARIFLIPIAVFTFRTRESVEGPLVIIDVKQQ